MRSSQAACGAGGALQLCCTQQAGGTGPLFWRRAHTRSASDRAPSACSDLSTQAPHTPAQRPGAVTSGQVQGPGHGAGPAVGHAAQRGAPHPDLACSSCWARSARCRCRQTSAAALQARRYERDLDARLAAFAKVCHGSDGDFKRKGDTGLAAEQVHCGTALCWPGCSACAGLPRPGLRISACSNGGDPRERQGSADLACTAPASLQAQGVPRPQLAQAKALEIEGLLERLSDTNARMGAQLSGVSDAQAHTLSNHRDKLADYQQVGRVDWLRLACIACLCAAAILPAAEGPADTCRTTVPACSTCHGCVWRRTIRIPCSRACVCRSSGGSAHRWAQRATGPTSSRGAAPRARLWCALRTLHVLCTSVLHASVWTWQPGACAATPAGPADSGTVQPFGQV